MFNDHKALLKLYQRTVGKSSRIEKAILAKAKETTGLWRNEEWIFRSYCL